MSVSPPTRAEAATPSWVRRHLRSLLAGSVLLALAVLAALAFASWHFSSEVLVPNHAPPPTDVTVQHVSAGRISLARSQATLRPGVYGLLWPKGHAIITTVLHRGSKSVTRSLSAVHGRLQAGIQVAIDSKVYVGNPRQALRLPFTNVSVPDELGPMPAWLIPGHGNTWAILVHGINVTRENGLRFAPALHASGLPTLLIGYRNDPNAPKSRDRLHHMGLTEWRDLEAAARYALANGARRLVLVGASMGGSIVTQFMQRSPLAHRVLGLILDAPALDWKAILSFNAREMGLPSFAATPVEWMIGSRIDANWSLLDALRHPNALHLPILLFHGTEDETVPIATSNELARELKGWVTYYKVAHAGHVESWNVDPRLYEQRVSMFLARIMGPSAPANVTTGPPQANVTTGPPQANGKANPPRANGVADPRQTSGKAGTGATTGAASAGSSPAPAATTASS